LRAIPARAIVHARGARRSEFVSTLALNDADHEARRFDAAFRQKGQAADDGVVAVEYGAAIRSLPALLPARQA
jgi:hypothetical protein